MRVNAFGLAAGMKLCAKMRLPGLTTSSFGLGTGSPENQSGCPGGRRAGSHPYATRAPSTFTTFVVATIVIDQTPSLDFRVSVVAHQCIRLQQSERHAPLRCARPVAMRRPATI